eukprot:CAMPEP_0179016742 /NCGR_PEP_ID=MMETSP0796-20121207/3478_1 /TAXON_ID=73915 /ORGANISM="Pyrodinium bahamense, Strain pbaha01" /LENGTH=124 /DNA_ID=CAMNT_0020712445 /DNA_START=321 /DNA_END=692 /DNA_ORIENTATION=+
MMIMAVSGVGWKSVSSGRPPSPAASLPTSAQGAASGTVGGAALAGSPLHNSARRPFFSMDSRMRWTSCQNWLCPVLPWRRRSCWPIGASWLSGQDISSHWTSSINGRLAGSGRVARSTKGRQRS